MVFRDEVDQFTKDLIVNQDERLGEKLGHAPAELQSFINHVLKGLKHRQTSQARQREYLASVIEGIGTPIGLPTIHANFADPEKTPDQIKAVGKSWLKAHEETIRLGLRPGAQPVIATDFSQASIPLRRNLVTNLFARDILRDILAPSTRDPGNTKDTDMIAQFADDDTVSGNEQSKYKFFAINALGVGTNNAAAAVGDSGLGAGSDPLDMHAVYHANKNAVAIGSLDAEETDLDLVLDTTYAVDAVASNDGGSTFLAAVLIAANEAKFTLSKADDSPSAGNYEFTIKTTFRRGSDGDSRDGNFGSDASPQSWREIALSNMPQDDLEYAVGGTKAGTHPFLHKLATRRVFPGNGFAKNSDVELTPEYTLRVSSG